ncbi:MAG: ATP-binding protein [Vulcanimicrobiaceae bacterium]
MRSRSIAAIAWAALGGVFLLDVLTPQTLVVAILSAIPIALAGFAASRRLTTSLVIAALATDALAAFANAQREGRWDPIGLADRFLSALAIVLVGFLATLAQERAQRAGALAEQQARARREASFAAAIDRIRGSLSPELVRRALVRESLALFESEAVFWFGEGPQAERFVMRRGDAEVALVRDPPPAEIASLARRLFDRGDAARLDHQAPVDALVLERLGAAGALAIPLADRERPLGLLVIAAAHDDDDSVTLSLARGLSRAASSALVQAHLFVQLSERNAELAERGAVIRDLVYALSHDLRTPLAALGMTLRQAEDGAYGPLSERYQEVLRGSIVAVDDLARLAETLLGVALLESGERKADERPLDVAEVVRQVGAEFEAVARARGVGLRVSAETAAPALADRGELRRAIGNVIANALEHTPAGGAVEVAVHGDEERFAIVVADDGYGVPDAIRGSLFERFASARTRGGGGTGLGLYLARRIVEASGGTIRYEPRAPRGSAFTLCFPRLRDAETVH